MYDSKEEDRLVLETLRFLLGSPSGKVFLKKFFYHFPFRTVIPPAEPQHMAFLEGRRSAMLFMWDLLFQASPHELTDLMIEIGEDINGRRTDNSLWD